MRQLHRAEMIRRPVNLRLRLRRRRLGRLDLGNGQSQFLARAVEDYFCGLQSGARQYVFGQWLSP